MKCPKCGYVSFDYNLSCPKCNKDISSEQEKLHIPAFRPDPPFLLGALTGEVNESHVGPAPAASQISFDKEADMSLDEPSTHEDSGEVSIDDSSELSLDSGELSLDDTSSLTLDTGEVQAQVDLGLDDGLLRLRVRFRRRFCRHLDGGFHLGLLGLLLLPLLLAESHPHGNLRQVIYDISVARAEVNCGY